MESPSDRASQETCDSPSEAILTITPLNPEAKLEFSHVVDWLHEQQVDDGSASSDLDHRAHTRKYMHIAREPVDDNDVAKFLRQREAGRLSSSPLASPSSERFSDLPPPSPATGPMRIWTGFYFLDLSEPPRLPARGWTLGRQRLDEQPNDIVLSLFRNPLVNIRQSHALFQVSNLGRVIIRSSSHAECSVGGAPLPRGGKGPLHLQDDKVIKLGNLFYRLAYGKFVESRDYETRLRPYLQQHLGQPISPLWDLFAGDTAADSGTGANTVIYIGKWRLTGAGIVGIGASGRVSIGVNEEGDAVALKRFAIVGDRARMLARKDKLQRITKLANSVGEERVLKLRDVLQDEARGRGNRAVDVWFVLEPAVPSTLIVTDRILAGKDRASRSSVTRSVVVELLRALHFLHSNGWIYGDLKPNNVGVLDQLAAPLKLVLLDMDEIFPFLTDGEPYTNPPGKTGGTVCWQSPEREMTGFDESCDMWSLGVLTVWLVTGKHPWDFEVNPWRPGRDFEKLRPLFHARFQDCISQIQNWEDAELAHVTLGMLRHPYAGNAQQRLARITAAEAIAILDPDTSQQTKRTRTG